MTQQDGAGRNVGKLIRPGPAAAAHGRHRAEQRQIPQSRVIREHLSRRGALRVGHQLRRRAGRDGAEKNVCRGTAA